MTYHIVVSILRMIPNRYGMSILLPTSGEVNERYIEVSKENNSRRVN